MVWTLTSPAFERLLTRLDEDRSSAATAYELLRRRLVALLRWWGAADPEALADSALDRVARKLEEGAAIESGSLGAYVRGVARMVYLESMRQATIPAAAIAVMASAVEHAESEALGCLDRCLAALGVDDRHLILEYYGEGKAADVRRRLAEARGLSSVALRIRAHRLREQLEQCVRTCQSRG